MSDPTPPFLRADCLLHRRTPPGELNGVSLAIEPGRFTLLSGNGESGASALLRILGLLERADEGEVWIDGRATSGLDDATRLELRSRFFGFLFAEPFLLDSFTVAENVAMPLFKIAGVEIDEARVRTAQVLAFAGLSLLADVPVGELGTLERHRVSLARAVAIEPRLLIAEDVALHLPAEEARGFTELVRSVPEALDIGVLATSPAGVEIFGAGRVIRLERGVIVGDNQPEPAQEAEAHD
jgi:ABC-type lipoprotein export system ATPase subunit